MSFPEIDEAHHKLVTATAELTKPGFDPIPISVVSVKAEQQSQLVVFDGEKYAAAEVVKRLRLAADLIEGQIA